MKKFLFPLIFLPVALFAQNELYNAGALIYMQPDALLHVQGTFTNTNSGTFQSDGILEVKGDLINNGSTFEVASLPSGVLSSSNTSNRVVKFVGTGAQHIRGQFNASGTQSLYNLVIDKGNANDAVVMDSGTSVTIDGSLIFGQTVGGTTPLTSPTYYPSSDLWTVNNNLGFLQTYEIQSRIGTQNIVTIANADTDAIVGYPSFALHSSANTGYVLTQGSLGDSTGSNTLGGLQRAIASGTTASRYTYPIGTIGQHGHGYNAFIIDFKAPVSAQKVIAKFVDSTSNISNFEGVISNYCAYCPFDTLANIPAPGFNYYFASDPCSGLPQWVILEDAIKNHGYWSIASTDTTTHYSVQMFPASYSDIGNPLASSRILKYNNANYHTISDYGYDPTNANWTSQIENVNSINDLLTYTSNTGCYVDPGVPGGEYSGFGNFAMFQSQQNNALPVTLLYLEANPVNNQYINVGWSTALEINNAGFYVMRSTDAIHFTTLGWVPGHGNSTSTQVYSYDDYAVAPNVVYYYKLRQVDNNGHVSETAIVDAQLTGADVFAVSDFIPNPAHNQSKLIVTTSSAQTIQVKLFDVLGRQLSVSSYDLTAGENNVELNVQQFADATYTAMISAGNRIYAKKLVISGY